MKLLTNQKSKEDTRVVRVVAVAESEDDLELLQDMVEYLKYRESEIRGEEQNANL